MAADSITGSAKTGLESSAEGRAAENALHAGRVLRGAAHEINNYLGAILAYAELTAASRTVGEDDRRMAQESADAARQAAAVLGVVAAIVSSDLVTVEEISLKHIVAQVCSLFRIELERLGSGIEVLTPTPPCQIRGVRSRIVRAVVHSLRHLTDATKPIRPVCRVRVRLSSDETVYRLDIESGAAQKSGGAAEPAGTLDEAREHLQYHHGELEILVAGHLRLTIPRMPGLD